MQISSAEEFAVLFHGWFTAHQNSMVPVRRISEAA